MHYPAPPYITFCKITLKDFVRENGPKHRYLEALPDTLQHLELWAPFFALRRCSPMLALQTRDQHGLGTPSNDHLRRYSFVMGFSGLPP